MKPVLSLECSCQPWEFGFLFFVVFFFLLGTGLVVTSVIISSCHSEGKNRIGRFGNFGARCAWSMTVIITLECTILAHWGAPQHPGLGWPLVLLSVLPLTSLTGHICSQSSLLLLVPLFTCLLYFIWENSHSPPGKGQSGPQLVVKKANQPLLPVSRADLGDTEGKPSCGEWQWPWPSWPPQLPSQRSVLTDLAKATWPFISMAGSCSQSRSRIKILYCALRREG